MGKALFERKCSNNVRIFETFIIVVTFISSMLKVFIFLVCLSVSNALKCWTCVNAQNDDECLLDGELKTCQFNEETCQTEIRRGGWGKYPLITKSCKQGQACYNNEMQNAKHAWKQQQCNAKIPSSVCKCCCHTDGCNKISSEDCGNPVIESCDNIMDLVVVLDSSSSIRQNNWDQMKSFVKTLLSGFTFGPDHASVSVVRYNEVVDTQTQILLSDFNIDRNAFMGRFDSIPYNGKGTKTGKAIDHVTDVLLARENGNRDGVHDVVLIITDGASQDDVTIPSQRLRSTGAKVLVLPIKFGGKLDMQQIRDMAGPGNAENIFLEAIEGGFDALDNNFAAKVTVEVCKGKPKPNPCDPSPCGNGQCTALDDVNYSCTCNVGFIFQDGTCRELQCPVLGDVVYGDKSCNGAESKQGTDCQFTCNKENYSLHPANNGQLTCMQDGNWNKEKPCCARKCPEFAVMDLVVVMDSSSSVKDENWVQMKKFVRLLLSGFAVAPDLAFLSVFRYNAVVDSSTQILLKEFPYNQSRLLEKFDQIPYDGKGTKTGQAIDHVTKVMLKKENGNRQSVQDIVLIITDGASQDDVIAPSQRLRNTGAQILVLPIKSGGKLDVQQINDMAGPGNDANIFWEASEKGFAAPDSNFAAKVTAGVCKDPCKHVVDEAEINAIINAFPKPDPCDPSPCGNGQCFGINDVDYSCTCNVGFIFTDGTCIELNPCDPAPCGNGQCVGINAFEYSCTCDVGFAFKDGTCIELDPCDSSPCGNGQCVGINAFDYSCTCNAGFTFEDGTCKELECPVLDDVLYGDKSCSGAESKQGTSCQFTCNKANYKLHPENIGELTCMQNGNWNKEAPCCARKCPDFAVMDLVVVMDSSSSVKDENWVQMKKFVRLLLSGFAVAPDLAFLSVFRYNAVVDSNTQILLNDFPFNKDGLLEKF